MPQWKPPTDTNLPAVPPAGAQLSPHQKWVAKQLSEQKDLSPRQQAWLEATRRNQKGDPTDPRETVPKVTAEQSAAASNRMGLSGLPGMQGMSEAPRPTGPIRSPLPSQTPAPPPTQPGPPPPAASSTRQNSMGVRRRRKVTEEETEEFDANSQAHHPAEAPPMQPPPPPPSSYEADRFGDPDDDGFGDEEEEEEEEAPEIDRPRSRDYPPPRHIQPYDARTDVMIEKFGQVANQMIFVVKENNYMAQQSAAESRKSAEMIRENANSMLKMMQEASAGMIRTFQENATAMMAVSVNMVKQADARRDSAEASQLRAMETYQNALTREAEAKIAVAQAEFEREQANALVDQVNEANEANAGANADGEASEESEGMIASLLGKGMQNMAGPLVDQVVTGVMNALGANGPKLNEDMVKSIAKSTADAIFENRAKAKAAATAATPPKS